MFNNNKKDSNLQKKPTNPVNINNNEYEEEYEFIEVNAATGDQYRKFGKIRSKNGQITSEMVNKFHDESAKEAREWRRNNPGVRSITFRDLRDENGKQVIKLLPTGDLIFPSEHRVAVYDENGDQIVGEENIRREIEKREAEWEQWEKEGKLQIVDYRSHDFDDGSLATVYFQIPPVKRHKNETDAIADQFEQVGKRLKVFGEEPKESGESNKLIGSSQVKGKIVEVDDDNKMDIDQPETQTDIPTSKIQENSPSPSAEISFKSPTDSELEKASKNELVDLIKRANKELERREKEANESQDNNTSNYEISTEGLKDTILKAQNRLQTLNAPTFNNDTPSNSGVGRVLAIVGVVSVFAVGGIALVKSKLGKNKKK